MRRVLIVQLRQLGDILLTTPCIREIKREMPKAQVTFLSHKMGKLILEGNPYLDEFYTYDPADPWWKETRLMRELKTKNFDLVLDFMANPRSALYSWMTRSSMRYAFRTRRRLFYTKTTPRGDGSEYIVHEKFRLLEEAGFSPQDIGLTLPWMEKHTTPLMQFLGERPEFRQSSLRVVMAPTHRREPRRWPLASWAALADILIQSHGASVTWLWGPGEQEEIDAVMALCREPTVKAPPTTFREMAAFVANCDLMVANSNGPSHVAVATGVCSVQLHGPTSGQAWCPPSPKHRWVQSATGRMSDIPVDAVLQALEEFQSVLASQVAKRQERGVRLKWNTGGL